MSKQIRFVGGEQNNRCHEVADSDFCRRFVKASSLSRVQPLSAAAALSLRPAVHDSETYHRRQFHSKRQSYELFVLEGLTADDVSQITGIRGLRDG